MRDALLRQNPWPLETPKKFLVAEARDNVDETRPDYYFPEKAF